MKNVGKMIDLARAGKKEPEVTAGEPIAYDGPMYPYGLCISLDSDTLERLDLSDDAEVGDTLHLFALARVTSKSDSQRESGKRDTRIELQITHIALENEDDENSDEDKQASRYGADDDEDED